jgi:arylsulfatase
MRILSCRGAFCICKKTPRAGTWTPAHAKQAQRGRALAARIAGEIDRRRCALYKCGIKVNMILPRMILPTLLPFLAIFPSTLAAEKPNVIIVITDDQGYGDLSCHGNPVLKTPNLDRLHAESVRLTDFHVAPMCTPTRGQLMSGVDCLRNGAINVSSGRTMLRRELPTMAGLFAAGGYRCGQFGKWHLGDNYPYRPHDRGFHEAVWYPSSHIGSAPDFWTNHYFDDTYYHNGRREKFSGYTTDVFFGEAMKWMRAQATAKRPFFCYLPTAAAHGPLFVPQKYRDLYKDQKPAVASFFGMIVNIDENMGRLETFLRETGLRDNTIVIFMTDNGGTVGVPIFNAGMKGGKVTLWEGGHRVPCFIRWPGGKLRAPGDVAGLTQAQDILPTLAELCTLPTPTNARFDGVSVAGALRGKSDVPDRTLVVQFSRMNHPSPEKSDACVMWRHWRLIQDKELYDLASDPQQKQNVIAQHPDVAARLRAHYAKWWDGVAPRMDEPQRFVIGHDAENPALLSPCEWFDVFLDQGAQVRRGEKKNGVWHVDVAAAGDYEFELRRWPREAGAVITDGLPAQKHADGEFPAGVALPIAKVRLKIGGFDQSRVVAAADKAVTFTAKLKSGQTQLQTWFYDAEGKELCGAYYVYARRK